MIGLHDKCDISLFRCTVVRNCEAVTTGQIPTKTGVAESRVPKLSVVIPQPTVCNFGWKGVNKLVAACNLYLSFGLTSMSHIPLDLRM
jgi:hypothetical protein